MKSKPSNKVFVKSASNTISAFATDKFISDITNFQIHNVNSAPSLSYFESKTSRSKSCPIVFLKIYFDFAYYLLLSPFRISVSDETGKFIIRKWRLQQFLCGLLQVMCTIRLLTDVRDVLQLSFIKGKQSPIQYFSIVQNVASTLYKLETMRTFWFKQKDYLRIFTFMQNSEHLSAGPKSKLVNKNFIRLIFGVAVTQSVASLIVGKHFVPEFRVLSPSLWFNQLVKLARYMLFIDSTVFDKRDPCLLPSIKESDIAAATFTLLSIIPRLIIGYFSDLYILSCAIPLWLVAKSFSDTIAGKDVIQQLGDYDEGRSRRLDRYSNWPEIYQHFREIQGFSQAINKALGRVVTCYLAEAIMYYSTNLTGLLTSPDIFMRVEKLSFYATTCGIFFFSADICNQLENIKIWLCHGGNRRMVPSDEFNLVLHEMIAKDVGIRGSNTFTITYSLLAVFLSTVVTYFIICVQDGSDDDSSHPIHVIPGVNSSCPIK